MSAPLKTITLYSHSTGPNPWKAAMILEELELPYEHEFVDMAVMRKPPYVNINPNGRVPAITDPNTGLTLWESGAIIEYLIDTYDTTHKLSPSSAPDKFYAKQWLFFQASGQGPYYGQAAWFLLFHPEKVDSALQRYRNEVLRVIGVLNVALEGKQYLVGDKISYADISFIPYNLLVPGFFGDEFASLDLDNKYPNYTAWHNRIVERPAISKVIADRTAAIANTKK